MEREAKAKSQSEKSEELRGLGVKKAYGVLGDRKKCFCLWGEPFFLWGEPFFCGGGPKKGEAPKRARPKNAKTKKQTQNTFFLASGQRMSM